MKTRSPKPLLLILKIVTMTMALAVVFFLIWKLNRKPPALFDGVTQSFQLCHSQVKNVSFGDITKSRDEMDLPFDCQIQMGPVEKSQDPFDAKMIIEGEAGETTEVEFSSSRPSMYRIKGLIFSSNELDQLREKLLSK